MKCYKVNDNETLKQKIARQTAEAIEVSKRYPGGLVRFTIGNRFVSFKNGEPCYDPKNDALNAELRELLSA